MGALFVSDIHLSEQRPAQAQAFFDLLREASGRARSLYLLGDVFDAWLGDDDEGDLQSDACAEFRALAEHGTSAYFMHGNHDFLLGEGFAERSALQLLDDPHVVEVHGQRVALSHGDLLCTDDTQYQVFRAWARNEANQRAFLSLSLAERARQAAALQEQSRASTRRKPAEIMDVNSVAVSELLRRWGIATLIHGHTHRPAVHQLRVDGQACSRYVLGDWYEIGNARVLWWPADEAPRLANPDQAFV